MGNLEQEGRQRIAVGQGIEAQIVALLQDHQHAENLADRTAKAAGDLGLAQPGLLCRQKLDDVEALLKGGAA